MLFIWKTENLSKWDVGLLTCNKIIQFYETLFKLIETVGLKELNIMRSFFPAQKRLVLGLFWCTLIL